MVKKASQGRKKIAIRRIEENNNRQVTFSKRRGGLFKKASELCVLTGAQIAIMVRSASGRVFAYGHPSPDLVFDRYLHGTTSKETATGIHVNRPIVDFNQHYLAMSKELEEEKKKKTLIDQEITMSSGMFWWDEQVDGLEMEALNGFVLSLEELKKKVVTRVDELVMIRASASLSSSSSKNQVVGLMEDVFVNYYGTNSIVESDPMVKSEIHMV